jgi:hypothetical protein
MNKSKDRIKLPLNSIPVSDNFPLNQPKIETMYLYSLISNRSYIVLTSIDRADALNVQFLAVRYIHRLESPCSPFSIPLRIAAFLSTGLTGPESGNLTMTGITRKPKAPCSHIWCRHA